MFERSKKQTWKDYELFNYPFNTIVVNELLDSRRNQIVKTILDGVYLSGRTKYEDPRGSFQVLGIVPDLEELLGWQIELEQIQISTSYFGVVRGIHAEPEIKLIIPLSGKFYCILVDLREGAPTFLKKLHIIFEPKLDGQSRFASLFIPEGVGNSFCCLSEGEYLYSVTKKFRPEFSRWGVRYDDPRVGINWPLSTPILSERDQNMPDLDQFLKDFGHRYRVRRGVKGVVKGIARKLIS